jgi:hypothetical protein
LASSCILSFACGVLFFAPAVCPVSQAKARQGDDPWFIVYIGAKIHISYQWVMFHRNEPRRSLTSHVSHTFRIGVNRGEWPATNLWCLAPMSHVSHDWVAFSLYSLFRVRCKFPRSLPSTSSLRRERETRRWLCVCASRGEQLGANESRLTQMSHVSHKWVMSHTN